MQKLFQTWDEAFAFTRSTKNGIVSRSPNGNGFRVEYDEIPEAPARNEAHEKEITDLQAQIEALGHILKEKENRIIELYSEVSDLKRSHDKANQDLVHFKHKCDEQSSTIKDLELFKSRENLVSSFFTEDDFIMIRKIIQKRRHESRRAERITKDCKCLGTNSNCSFCSGRGYYITDGNGEIKN